MKKRVYTGHTDSTSIHTVADSRHDATDDHVRDAVGAGLKSGANDENAAAGNDTHAPAQSLANEECGQGTEEASLSRQLEDPSEGGVHVTYNLIDSNPG